MVFSVLASVSSLQPWMFGWIVFLEPQNIDWNELKIEATVLISLLCQVVLILLGNRRKYMAEKRIMTLVWVAYNAAEWAATFALTAISYSFSCPGVDKRGTLTMAFWAPFMLVHLGGPDTITALSLEDNELWLRYGLVFCTRLFFAFLIVYKSWVPMPTNILSILVLFVGAIKYGERIWVLCSSSNVQFRKSMLHDPDTHTPEKEHTEFVPSVPCPPPSSIPNAATLSTSYYFFVKFKPLFADLMIGGGHRKVSQSYFQSQSWGKAFEVVEYEISFLFDTLYTKATLIYSHIGRFIRFINLILMKFVLVAFLLIGKPDNSANHMFAANLLMIGAIVLELYAAITLLYSDWTAVSFIEQENSFADATYKVICWPRPWLQKFRLIPADDKWCNSLAQYNFFSSCLVKKPFKSNSLNKFYKMLRSGEYKSLRRDLSHLKMFIFEDLKKKSSQATDVANCKRLCSQKGEQVLKEWMHFELVDSTGNNYATEIRNSMKAEFDESILVWHIATDLCYYSDFYKNPDIPETIECKASKALSDYMLHLLVECHPMLPYCVGSKMRYKDTHKAAMEFFKERRKLFEGGDEKFFMEMIVRECTGRAFDVKQNPGCGRRQRTDQAVFDEGCMLARCLLMLRAYGAWEKEKWAMIREVWVEMLCYVAVHCSFTEHAKQLRQGGELLTHVCLLMTHLGISDRFQN